MLGKHRRTIKAAAFCGIIVCLILFLHYKYDSRLTKLRKALNDVYVINKVRLNPSPTNSATTTRSLLQGEARMRANALHTLNKCAEWVRDGNYSQSLLGTSKPDVSKTLAQHNRGWLVTPLPKCGWSTIVNMLFRGAGTMDLFIRDHKSGWQINYTNAGYEKNYLTEMISSNLSQQYTERVVFVRHPFDRLVSAYKDKALRLNGTYCKRWHNPCGWYNKQSTTILTFKQFCGCIIRRAKYQKSNQDLNTLWERNATVILDQHWAPQSHLSLPCGTNYSLISKHETFESDAETVMQLMNFEVAIVRANPSFDSPVKEWIDQLDGDMMKDLIEIYKFDFELFGYDPYMYFFHLYAAADAADDIQ